MANTTKRLPWDKLKTIDYMPLPLQHFGGSEVDAIAAVYSLNDYLERVK